MNKSHDETDMIPIPKDPSLPVAIAGLMFLAFIIAMLGSKLWVAGVFWITGYAICQLLIAKSLEEIDYDTSKWTTIRIRKFLEGHWNTYQKQRSEKTD